MTKIKRSNKKKWKSLPKTKLLNLTGKSGKTSSGFSLPSPGMNWASQSLFSKVNYFSHGNFSSTAVLPTQDKKITKCKKKYLRPRSDFAWNVASSSTRENYL
jgi:hypothetical protein